MSESNQCADQKLGDDSIKSDDIEDQQFKYFEENKEMLVAMAEAEISEFVQSNMTVNKNEGNLFERQSS